MKNKVKILAALVLSLSMLFVPCKAANNDITILKDGTPIVSDVSNYRWNGRSYVSIRAFFDSSSTMLWDSATKTAFISTDKAELSFTKGDKHFFYNNELVETDSQIQIVAGRMFVPLRALANALSYDVSWNESSKTASVKSVIDDEINTDIPLLPSPPITDTVLPPNNNENVVQPPIGEVTTPDKPDTNITPENFDADSLYWLSRIICAESCIEPYKGKLAVGEVVLNRVKSPNYPNTVKGVVFDKRYAIQFEPVANGTVYNTPDDECIKAAKECLKGVNVVGDCLYFLNPLMSQSTWIQNNCRFVMTIGSHDFYL